MTIDSTLAFAVRRNIPVRYNRTHIATTLAAMQRIATIRARRERAFYKKRMAGNKIRRRELDRRTVREGVHLLGRERGSERVKRVEREREQGMEVDVAVAVVGVEKKKKEIGRKVVRTRVVGGGVGMEIDKD